MMAKYSADSSAKADSPAVDADKEKADDEKLLHDEENTESWTCKYNRKSFSEFDAVHVIFSNKNFLLKENFYLFTRRDPDTDKSSAGAKTNKKYMLSYCGAMDDVCYKINRNGDLHRNGDLPNAAETKFFAQLKQEMDDLYEKTKPDKDGVSYYECEETTDDGYWHDSAQRILRETTHENTTAMNKFVHAIAKRLFKVEYESHKKFTYNFKPQLHSFALDDEFHVIVRLQHGKPLIFFCSKDQQPNNCVPCSRERAVGPLSLPTQSLPTQSQTQSPRPSSANSSGSRVRVYAGNYKKADPALAADAANNRRHVANLRGLAGRRHPHPNYTHVPGYEV